MNKKKICEWFCVVINKYFLDTRMLAQVFDRFQAAGMLSINSGAIWESIKIVYKAIGTISRTHILYINISDNAP